MSGVWSHETWPCSAASPVTDLGGSMALWLFIIMSITRHYPGGKCAPGQTQDLSRGSNDYQEFLSIPILFSHKQSMKLSSLLSNFFSSTPRFIQILSGTLKQTV